MYLLSVPITILGNLSVINSWLKNHLIFGVGFPAASQNKVVDRPDGSFRLNSTFWRSILGGTKLKV